MPTTAELEFRIEPFSKEKSGHPVSAQLLFNGQKQVFEDALLAIDLELLSNLRGEPDKYHAALTQMFFKGDGVETIRDGQLPRRAERNRTRARLKVLDAFENRWMPRLRTGIQRHIDAAGE